ncbi:hypothetical protein [Malacoplasma iowae]|uniref:Uncharacterized protein n=1 Tax=Malacoplasma iowae DK-CPA TaxID=1394179 RepID=A0A084U2U7_MALIO|nr:hypothetical protein [Malacoplasma iowae]KFB07283.1 hypothetical protein P271_110 [Malacoplasma iowae DK-CPA]
MAANQRINFKEIADRVIQIKQMIENNYFLISNKIEKIMSSSNDKKLIDHCLHKQKVLDDGISQISTLLEKIAARYYINIENEQNEKLKNNEKELLEKISRLEKEAEKRGDQKHDLIDNAEVENNFGKDNLNEIKDLRNELDLINKAIENNEYELSGFDSIGFEDFSTSIRKIANENEALKDKLVENDLRDEFIKQQNIDVMNSLSEIEKNLSNKIEEMKTDSALAWDTNTNLIKQLEQAKLENANGNGNQINTAAIEQLDIAINSMISKVENSNVNTMNLIDNFSKSLEVKNLETMTNAIVNSLEKNIQSLTSELNDLKSENKLYKKENEEKQNLINSLKEDSIKKENELNNSYGAWVYNNKKLEDLQELLDKQSVELYELDGQKSVIINTLQDKLILVQEELEKLIQEKNDLLTYQNELLDYIEQNKKMFEFAYGVSDFDDDVEATSLKELVEKEASKVLDSKVSELLNRYRNELNDIEESLKQSFLKYQTPNDTKDLLTSEIEKLDNNDLISSLESKVDSFDRKIKNLETEFRDYKTNKDKTLYTIDDLNEALGTGYYDYKNSLMDDEIKMKLDRFENNLSEKIKKAIDDKIRELNITTESIESDEYYLTDNDIEEIVTNSNLYNEIKNEVKLLQNQVGFLKSENIKIKEENKNVNYQLDNSLNKFTYNNEKMREVENLLAHNIEELERLNNDKDELILELERRLKISGIDKIKEGKQKEQLTDIEVKKLIDERVDQILNGKTSSNDIYYQPIEDNEYDENIYYENISLDNFDTEPIEYVETYYVDNDEVETKQEEKDDIPVAQSFVSGGYFDEPIEDNVNKNKMKVVEKTIITKQPVLINGYKKPSKEKIVKEDDYPPIWTNEEPIEKPIINNNDELTNTLKELVKEIRNADNKEKNNLEKEIEELRQNYLNLVNQLNKTEENLESHRLENNFSDDVPIELIESNMRLKNFEKLLTQLDVELSNLENNTVDLAVQNSQGI